MTDEAFDSRHIVLAIGDTHFPFVLPDYLDFICSVAEKHDVDRVVHMGDIVDNHASSYHETDPDGMSAGDELAAAKRCIVEWASCLPEMEICTGNHDKIPRRKIMSSGLPASVLRENYYGIPDGWSMVESLEIDNVLYTHGMGAGGENGARNLARRRSVSCVIGHFHRSMGTHYTPSHDGGYLFGMSVGCGVDYSSYSQEYSKDWGRMALGCGVVRYGVEAYNVPMLRNWYQVPGNAQVC